MEEVYDYYKEKDKRQKSGKGSKGKITALIIFALIVVAALIGSSIYMELIQLKELNPNADYTTVYTKNLLYKTVFFIISFVLITLFIFITNKVMGKNLKSTLQTITLSREN